MCLTTCNLHNTCTDYHVVVATAVTLGVKYPKAYNDLVQWMDVMNMNLSWLLSAGCVVHVSFYTKLLLTTLLPLFVVALLGVIHLIVRYKHSALSVNNSLTNTQTQAAARADLIDHAVTKHSLVFLVFTFLIFPSVSTTVLETFACDYLKDTGEHWLRADYSISCDTHTWNVYRAYAAVMVLIYPLGIPGMYSYLLWKHKKHILVTEHQVEERDHNVEVQTSRFLWGCYRVRQYKYMCHNSLFCRVQCRNT
jgi:hypothetical protein